MQLILGNVTSKHMAGSFMIAGATIFCWTSAMGAAASQGAGQTLLDGITVATVAALGCMGCVSMLRAKKHAVSTRPTQTAQAAPAKPQESSPDKPSSTAPYLAEEGTAVVPLAAADENATPSPQSATERACRALAQAHDLSLRERDVLDLMATGMTGKEIATELTLSYNTVKSHIRHIYAKLDVHRKQDLADLIDQQRKLLDQQRSV